MSSHATARLRALMFLICLAGFWGAPIAQAQPVAVPNPSFESGDDAPEGWRLSRENGFWAREGADGARAIAATGDGKSESASYWLSRDLPLEPGATYRLRFQGRHVEGIGRSLFSGFLFNNRDLPELTQEWRRFTTHLAVPTELRQGLTRLRFGQYDIEGTVAFDDLELVRTIPVYRRMGDLQLGEGERIEEGWYVFNAPFEGESGSHARPLEKFNTSFNRPRWLFGPGDWVIYRHAVGSLTQTGGTVEVNVGYYSGGELVVEAGRDGEAWKTVGTLNRRETKTLALPAELFPAKELWVRLRMPAQSESGQDLLHGGSLQVHGYTYRAGLADAPGNFLGATRFVAVTVPDPSLRVSVEDFGAAIPGENTLRVQVANPGGGDVEIAPVIAASTAAGKRAERVSDPVVIPAGGDPVALALPYEIPGIGDIALDIALGGASGFRAETSFFLSPLHEADYGLLLPGNGEDVVLWGASSGWKVSRDRPAPREQGDALRISAARNEREAAQVVLRPSKPLRGLRCTPGALAGPGGAELPASAVTVLRVGYVPVEFPTDFLGAAAPWPDPLPPFDGPADLEAGVNQPLWVLLSVPRDAPAGLYRGSLLLEAEGWRAEVPLEAEVFGFTLPDRKTCQTAFGFDGETAVTYHGARSAEDRRTLAALYAEAFSAHHISPYELGRPLIYPELSYSWPHPPQWSGQGVRVTGREFREGGAMRILDDDTGRTVKASYDRRFDIPEQGFKAAFRHRSEAPDQEFELIVSHYDRAGEWMSGRNSGHTVKGSAEWQDAEITVDTFPEGAAQAAFEWQPAPYAENGSTTGTVWLDSVRISDAGSGAVLLEDEFAPCPAGDLDRFFTPAFDWAPWDAAMTRVLDTHHFNSFVLKTPGLGFGAGWAQHGCIPGSLLGYGEDTPEYQAAFTAWYSEAERHLRAKGWLDEAFIYWFDEPEPHQYDFVMEGNRRMKAAAPDLQRMLTEKITPELVGGPNLWCPVSYEFDPKAAAERRAAGDRLWWYICCGPKAPYATLFIDHPGTELRVWLWQTWQRQIEGILIWQTNYWTSDAAYPDSLQNPYKDPMGWVNVMGDYVPRGARKPWGNGDGRFLYPPLKAAAGNPETPVLEPPVSSIRIEMLRDGIEDYEYLAMLQRLVEERKDGMTADELAECRRLLEVPPEISAGMTEFTGDPAPIEARRGEVARAIVRLTAGK